MWFLTEYRPDWGRPPRGDKVTVGNYGAHLFAKNIRHARRTAKKRGLNERILSCGSRPRPYRFASEHIRAYYRERTPKHFRDALHALNYLGMIALAAGVAKPHEIVGDEGIVHDFLHPNNTRWPAAHLALVVEIERRTPGYRPKN